MSVEEFTPGWRGAHVGVEGAAVSIDGINPWNHRWARLQDEPIVVPHPSYPSQRHKAWIYEVNSQHKNVVFAATELSNGVWGFYAPVTSSNP